MTARLNPTDFFSHMSHQQLLNAREKWNRHFSNDDGTITAWTVVSEEAYATLEEEGFLTCPAERSEADYQTAYAWMAATMERLGLASPREGLSPLWCWVQAGEKGRKPDHRLQGEEGYLIEVRIPSDQLLISNFEHWHYVLNYWPVFSSVQASDAYDAFLEAKGLSYYSTKQLPEPYHQDVTVSWNQIFDLEFHLEGDQEAVEEMIVQATFWTLRRDDVVSAQKLTKIHNPSEDSSKRPLS